MPIYLIDKIKPKNSGSFAMVESADVEMSDGTRLEAFLEAMLEALQVDSEDVVMSDGTQLEDYLAAMVSSFQVEVDYENDVAFDTSEMVVGVYTDDEDEDTGSDDNSGAGGTGSDDPEDTDETTPAILGVAILGRTILGQY